MNWPKAAPLTGCKPSQQPVDVDTAVMCTGWSKPIVNLQGCKRTTLMVLDMSAGTHAQPQHIESLLILLADAAYARAGGQCCRAATQERGACRSFHNEQHIPAGRTSVWSSMTPLDPLSVTPGLQIQTYSSE
jgi:hypothetical protein